MGAAATFVLFCSNIAISALRKVIPDKGAPALLHHHHRHVRDPGADDRQAYAPALDTALGVYLPLIVVNCIILGRAEMFACKNNVVDSALDGLGMGLGFTLALILMATVREILGSGTWLGIRSSPRASPTSP